MRSVWRVATLKFLAIFLVYQLFLLWTPGLVIMKWHVSRKQEKFRPHTVSVSLEVTRSVRRFQLYPNAIAKMLLSYRHFKL